MGHAGGQNLMTASCAKWSLMFHTAAGRERERERERER